MNSEFEVDLERLVRSYALLDGLKHDGQAQVKSVMSKLLGDHPELRARAREIGPIAARIVKKIGTLSMAEQHEELEILSPEMVPVEDVGSEPEKSELPPLPNAIQGKMVMRFAPGPSGPLHLGHSRAVILNDEYRKRYEGCFILRLEDTNPGAVDLAAYDRIREDLDWLGVDVDREVIQSDRLDIYYSWAGKVLEGGHGFVCTCPAEEWRKLKNDQQPCPHRNEPPESHLERWERMRAGAYGEGEASVVVKTALDHPNPAVRDFVALRISDIEHPLRPDERVWPLMNFSVAVDDHELGLTHVLRGKDHLNNTLRQEYLFNYFKWPKPHYTHYGFVRIPEVILKTSTIKMGIAEGTYLGWDDIRLGTLKTLRRRGYQPEALRKFWIEASIHEVEFTLSWENLNALNKGLIEPEARRFFFVPEPRWFTFEIPGNVRTDSQAAAPATAVPGRITPQATADTEGPPRRVHHSRRSPAAIKKKAPWQPDKPEWGYRTETIATGTSLAIPGDDVERLRKGLRKDQQGGLHRGKKAPPMLRLKNLCNAVLEGDSLVFAGAEPFKSPPKPVPIIQWVCDQVPMTLAYPDGRVIEGVAEPAAAEPRFEGRVVQFERVGFVRLEGEGRAAWLHG